MTYIIFIDSLLFFIISISLYTDLKSGKIYNCFTLPSIIAGFILNMLLNPANRFAGLSNSFLGFAIAFAFFIIPYVFGALGAGDVKLLMAIGALKGYSFIIYTTIATGLVSFILALLVFIMEAAKSYKFRGLLNIIVSFYYKNVLVTKDELQPILKKNLKFGISIFFGTIIAYFYMKY